jgi:integrase
MRFTAKALASFSVPKGKADHIEFDDALPGFGIRFRNGKASWIFQWSTGSGVTRRTSRMKIGIYPALPLEQARKIAAELNSKITLGHDPSAEKRERIEEAADTFCQLAKDYLAAQEGRLSPTMVLELRRYLTDYAAPLHRLPVKKVNLKILAKLLDDFAKGDGINTGRPRKGTTVNRMRSALSACFQWAMKKGRAESNPVLLTEQLEETARDRVLRPDEIKTVWDNAGDDDYGTIVRLLILTGQRRDEISKLRWDEVKLDLSVIALPASRVKNDQPHDVPMSAAVRSIIAARPRSESALVFAPTLSWSRRKLRLDAAITEKLGKPLAPWTLHDLRRSCATGMADMGIQPHVVEAVLNHISGSKRGVAGVYNRSTYAPEKKAALNRWAKRVLEIVNDAPSNVTALHGRA